MTEALAEIPPTAKRGRPRKKPLDLEHREARAGLILAAKLANRRTEEICQEFRLSRATVYRALADARRLGLLTQARDWLTLNLVPLSLAAIEEALLMGDIPTKVDTAFRVLDGLGVTGRHAVLTVKEGDGETSFESFRAEVIQRVVHTKSTGPAGGHADEHHEVVDAVPEPTVEAGTPADGPGDDSPPVPAPGSPGECGTSVGEP